MPAIDSHTHVPATSDLNAFLTEMRNSGVCLAITSCLGIKGWPAYPAKDEIPLFNDHARSFSQRSGGMVLWLGYLNPLHDNAAGELERCASLGCRGVKLWVSLKDENHQDPGMIAPLLHRAAQLGLPVKIHTFQRTGENMPGEVSSAEVAELARLCPETTIIAAHAGGNWRQSHGIFEDLPNVLVDVCGTFPEAGMVETLVQWLGAERVLFGSDAVCGAQNAGRCIAAQLAKVQCARLPEEARRLVLFGNARRIYRITDRELQTAYETASRLPPSTPCALPDMQEDHSCIYSPGCSSLQSLAQEARQTFLQNETSFFADDLISTNQDFLEACAPWPSLVPLATLHPDFYNWPQVLEHARRHFRGALLLPYLHNWDLASPRYSEFFQACAKAKLPLWISLCSRDARFAHPSFHFRTASQEELLCFLNKAPQNQYVILNAAANDILACLAIPRDDVRFDIARLVDISFTYRKAVAQYGTGRLVYGSDTPARHSGAIRFTAEALANPLSCPISPFAQE